MSRPRDPSPGEIAWVKHLLANERNALLLAPHGVVLYSIFTERLSGRLQFLWRSRTDTLHSRYIDNDVFRQAGRVETAPVTIHIFDSSAPGVAACFEGCASKLHGEDQILRAADIYRSVRLARGDNPDPQGTQLELYVADITVGSVTTPRVDEQGNYVGEGHANLRLLDLGGFEAEGNSA